MPTGYRLYPSTNGPSSSSADPTDYVMGLSFEVVTTGYLLDGFWWWVADANQSVGPQDFGLWESTGTGTGTFVAGSKFTSAGNFTVGVWNFVICAPPVPLLPEQEYRAVTHTLGSSASPLNGYSATGLYFTSGGPAAGGITQGPLFAYSGNAGNPGTVEPFDSAQMSYYPNGTDVTADYPVDQFNAANYWLDVQIGVAAAPGPPVLYSMRTFP